MGHESLPRVDRPDSVNTGPAPLIDERRLIDNIWHCWCGQGWIAETYSNNVVWPVQLVIESGGKEETISRDPNG